MTEPGFSQSSADEQKSLPPRPTTRPIWPWLLLIAGLMLVLVLRATLMPESSGGRDGQDAAGIGSKVTAFELQPLTGNPRPASLADLEGKVTLINIWGPWCGPCAIEFPHLMELVQHFRGEPDFQFLSISSNRDPSDTKGLAESTAEFLKQHQAEIPTYRDPNGRTIATLANDAKLTGFGFPTTVAIDRAVVIRGVWVGYRPGDERGMRQAIERLLKNEPIGVASGEPEQAASN
jgi:thiol-disulfide isomerase/thioredoxin